MKAYRITYECLLPNDGRVTLILAALDRLVVGAGGEPGANANVVQASDGEPRQLDAGSVLASIERGGESE